MEWDVGIPGKQNVNTLPRLVQSAAHHAPVRPLGREVSISYRSSSPKVSLVFLDGRLHILKSSRLSDEASKM